MSWHRVSRKYHKWLMLFIGVQFVIWSVSGAYMVIFDIDYIHGDSLIANHQTPLASKQINYSLAQLYAAYPNAKHIEITALLGQAVYRFSDADGNGKGQKKHLISADNGTILSPISEDYAVLIARYLYDNTDAAINTELSKVSLIKDNPPFELNARHLPVWRVDFDHFSSPSLYISVETGKLVTKRHTFWRLFDWMFSFHVMDYVEEDPSNKLLLVVAILALIASLFGAVLTYFRVFKTNGRKKKGSNRKQKQNVRNAT